MSFFEKDEWKFLGKFYLEEIIATLLFIYPAFWVLYFRSIDLSITQIGFIIATVSFTSLIFEIPTGAIADLYGRKFSVILGYILSGLAAISVFFVKSYYGLIVVFALWGIFGTLISGAKDAWVVDNLSFNKRKKLMNNYFIKRHSFVYFSLIFAGIIGALLVKRYGLSIIWLSSGIAFFISTFILILISEEKEFKRDPFKELKKISNIFKQSKDSIKYSLKHKVLFIFLIITILLAFIWAFEGDLLWQPFLKSKGFPVYAFGYLFTITAVIGTFVPYLSKPLMKIFKKEKILLGTLSILTGFVIFLVMLANTWILGIILWILITGIWNTHSPLHNSFFQKFIPSDKRATITSFEGMLISLGAIMGAPIVGFIADKIGAQITIVIGGIIFIPTAILYFIIKEKNRHLKVENR